MGNFQVKNMGRIGMKLTPRLTPDTLQVLRELAAESSCKPTS